MIYYVINSQCEKGYITNTSNKELSLFEYLPYDLNIEQKKIYVGFYNHTVTNHTNQEMVQDIQNCHLFGANI